MPQVTLRWNGGSSPCSWLCSHSPMLQPSVCFHALEHCVWCAPPSARPSPPGKLCSLPSSPHTHPSLCDLGPDSPLCAGFRAQGTLCASDLLLRSFSPSAHRVLRTGMGWGSVLHAGSAQCVLVGTKSDVHNGGESILENSYPGLCRSQEEDLKFFPFTRELLLNLLLKSYCKCCG